MTDAPENEAEALPVIRLRDAIAFYDSLPAKTRKRFCELTDSDFFERHHGFGMMFRNALLWRNDIKLLAAELTIVKEEVENGRNTLTYTHVGNAAQCRAADSFFLHADSVSSDLMDVLRLREGGKLELLELN
jgi:hypothetical protein